MKDELLLHRLLLHRLWSKAVCTPDYDKTEWKDLERALEQLQGGLREACELVQAAVMEGDLFDWYERGEPSPADRRFELSKLAK